jgi:hypothetical protein
MRAFARTHVTAESTAPIAPAGSADASTSWMAVGPECRVPLMLTRDLLPIVLSVRRVLIAKPRSHFAENHQAPYLCSQSERQRRAISVANLPQ